MVRNGMRWFGVFVWLAMFLPVVTGVGALETFHVDVLEIEGPVTPIMISYIERGIRNAETGGAEAMIIQLDTPGGQIDLMSDVVQALLQARVPVVVYVYPQGAYAASAGTLITRSNTRRPATAGIRCTRLCSFPALWLPGSDSTTAKTTCLRGWICPMARTFST